MPILCHWIAQIKNFAAFETSVSASWNGYLLYKLYLVWLLVFYIWCLFECYISIVSHVFRIMRCLVFCLRVVEETAISGWLSYLILFLCLIVYRPKFIFAKVIMITWANVSFLSINCTVDGELLIRLSMWYTMWLLIT